VAQQGWTVQPGTLETIVTRAPTHEPYPYHSKGVNVTSNLNSATAPTSATTTTTATSNTQNAQALAQDAYQRTNATAVQNPISAENYLAEQPAVQSIPII
jgi:hypothetical protein